MHTTPLILAFTATPALVQAATAPALMQAQELATETLHAIGDYLVSEKLDGVRAYWTGQALLTRSGLRIDAPDWFIAHLPPVPLDGELWAGRGLFEQVSTLIRRVDTPSADWRRIEYQLFDLPAHPGTFTERQSALKALIDPLKQPHLHVLEQRTLVGQAELEHWLEEIRAGGGEGLMLHHHAARYRPGRSDLLLKYKPFQDAEARVIGYTPGQGKYAGLTGALLVEDDQGRRFRLGSGLSDADRADPPPIGTLVTYRYNGVTSKGLPRFARFMRVRQPEF